MQQAFHTEPAIEVTRGDLVESLHHAAVAVVRSDGALLYSLGDANLITYMRSAAKPFQALPIVESGVLEEHDFGVRELAIICASHSGEPFHTELVQSMLDRIGMSVADLRCGTHYPMHAPTTKAMREAGIAATPLHNNCSGKHTGMLALSAYLGVADRDYRETNHPVQQRDLAALAEMAGVMPDSIFVAVDGCSVPSFALPLRAAALAFARLLDPQGVGPTRAAAARRVAAAMQAYPELVAGDDRFDTWLMANTPGLVCKGGAEGYHGVGVMRGGEALGIVCRVADGDVSGRAVPPLVLEVLAQLGVQPRESEAAARWREGVVRNRHATVVGAVRPAFRLRPA